LNPTPFHIGLIGLGQVGSALARRLQRVPAATPRAGRPVILAAVAVRDPTRQRPFLPDAPFVSPESLIDDPAIDAVVELVGGLEPAQTWLRRALIAGKQVITANKQLIAVHGPALAAAGGALRFEAAVASAIPIVEAMASAFLGETISEIVSILNGTTNFILGRMTAGQSYAQALAAAQATGLAEADPSQDVEGHDAAAKLAILCMLAFRIRVAASSISRAGITGLDLETIRLARARARAVKLIAAARRTDDGELLADVRLRLVPVTDPLGAVKGAFNGIRIEAGEAGPLYFEGLGAGPEAAASAVLSDVLRAARGVPPAAGTVLASLASTPEMTAQPLPDQVPYPPAL
jgi:homoserine dehydrogenase